MRILDLPVQSRPRERLLALGPSALSDSELLALILKSASPGESALDLSARLLATFGLERLSKCPVERLCKVRGIKTAKACQIAALFELHRRCRTLRFSGRPIRSSKDVFSLLSPKLSHLEQEHLVLLHLDCKNRVIKEQLVSLGTKTRTLVSPAEILSCALQSGCAAIILAHNHPSGDPTPSQDDRLFSQRASMASKIVGIPLLDHVILGRGCWSSLMD